MPAAWPGTLPQRLQVDDFQNSMPDGRLRSKTDKGPGKSRPRSKALGEPMSGSMEMTAAQWLILKGFISADLAVGTLPFTFPDPDEGADLLVRIGDAMPGRVNLGGDNWRVSLSLEVLP